VNLPVDELSELLATLQAQRRRCGDGSCAASSRRGWSTSGKPTRQTVREATMAEVLGGRQTLPVEEVVLAQMFQLDALLNVLERQGVFAKAEVQEEIKRLRAKTPKGT
jgi:hypothetical protein